MAKFVSKAQLKLADIEEIDKFFDDNIFQGVFSKEIKSKHPEWFKGSVSNIRLDGATTDILGSYINVPASSNIIKEGPCQFKCRLKSHSPFQISLIPNSLENIDNFTETSLTDVAENATETDLFQLWGVDSTECIGFYHHDEEKEIYVIDDIRKPNFDHIPYYPTDSDKRPIRLTYHKHIYGIKENDYYLFNWKLSHRNILNPYEIYIDFNTPPRKIQPKWFIDKLFKDRHDDKSKNFSSATNFLDTLSKQLSANDSTFIYELLQNANDYPVEGKMVDVVFHITDNYLLFLHSGDAFNVRNISGICGINEKEKVANKRTIGYKGIGFKTVFLNNHYVYIQTGDYSFRFDEGETPEKKPGGKIRRLEAPFQILPIWTPANEVAPEVRNVFRQSGEEFRVRIALRPDNKDLLHVGRNNYESLFKSVFSDSNIILFIPNINSVRVIINGVEERVCLRNNKEWVVSDYEVEIQESLQLAINKTIDKGNTRIPEKYKDFDYTKVSFACKRIGATIQPIEHATVYCYLPTSASWGFHFLLNTDMIPKGDRNDIEKEVVLADGQETNFNEELASIAGDKFFDWIRDLLTSREYQLASVFSLIPDFKKCKKEHDFYDSFIAKFESAFESRLDSDHIVPVSKGISLIKSVILDTTGLSSSDIMTDDEFRKFTDMEDLYLPLHILRKDKNFNSFLKRYASDSQVFDKDEIYNLISHTSFQEWLKNQENNNRFLNFLLEKKYLQDFLDEKIFLEADGGLYRACELYYDIDKYLADLDAFTDYLYYLSPQTREYFAENSQWDDAISGSFAKFDEDKFVNDILLDEDNIEATKERLKNFDTSVHFFSFLAIYVGYTDNYKQLPFYDANGEVVESFEGKFVFFHSIEGETLCASKWLENVVISFISDSYSEVAKSYFKKFDVQDYSDDIIVKDIILSEDYTGDISSAIDEDIDLSVDFINFCFKNKDIIPPLGLKSYTLNVYDCNGDSDWYINDNVVYFPSSQFDYYSQKEWIDSSWLTCLNVAYIPDKFAEEEYKKFFTDAFGIEELTDVYFYKNVVRKNLTNLFSKIKGQEDKDGHKNIDFVNYLDENYNLIFEEENDAKLFSALVIASEGGFDVNLNDASLYIYSKDLADIIGLPWFPDKVVTMTHNGYGSSKALEKLGIARYTFSDFYDKVLVGNLVSINNKISTIDNSVAFHNFIIEHKKSLLDEQLAKMKNAKVFLYGVATPVSKATGHNILSQKATELFKLGLVNGSSLDLIAAEYNPDANTDYWETRLENSKFTLSHFAAWLKSHRSEFNITLKDKTKNIAFWRWLKENQNETLLKEVVGMTILLSDGSYAQSEAIFFSDAYLGDSKIESTVQRFNKAAHFLSPSYMKDGEEISEWKSFFSKVGVKFEIVDILIETIDNSLSSADDTNLIRLITDNREALENHYGDDLIGHLHDLRVKAKDDNFYSISDTILINCESDEPFGYITIPNQISFSYPKENRLIDDLMQDIKGRRIQNLTEWKQLKLDHYLALQEKDDERIRPIHFQFVEDLSKIRNSSTDSLAALLCIDKIKVLDRKGAFQQATSLTISSVYNPFFDFEKCGVVELDYVSDEYSKKCSEYVGRFFRSLNMHRDFIESDIKYLANRSCSIYFWTEYLEKQTEADTKTKIASIQKMITEHKFDDVSCIPTKDYMKRPSELYYGKEVDKFIEKLEDWENKTPLVNLPEVRVSESGLSLFGSLPFKKSLDFLDALYALFNVHNKENRPQILRWLIDGYDPSFMPKINEYRDDELALWKNSQGEKVQIQELYALEYGNRKLEQYFGSNPKIINKDYLPAGDAFREACDILQIRTIADSDFSMDPVNDTLCRRYNSDLKLFALIIAGIISSEDWKDLYNGFCSKLDTLILHRCDSILIKCNFDSSINQSFKQFYHQDHGTDFYFVDDIYESLVFLDFVNEYISYLEIEGIENDLVKLIMHSRENALKIVQTYHSLISNEGFKEALITLAPQLRDKLISKKEDEDDDVSSISRPEFTTTSTPTQSDSNYSDSEGDNGVSSSDGEGNDEYTSSSVNVMQNGNIGTGTSESSDNPNSNAPMTAPTVPDVSGDIPECGEEKGNTPKYTSPSDPICTHSQKEVDVPSSSETPADYVYDGEDDELIGSVDNDSDYDNLDDAPTKPRGSKTTRRHPKPYTKAEVNRLRSNPSPLALESLPPTKEELEILGQMNITPEQIADTNYLAQLRLYQNLIERGDMPEETREDFVRNAADVTTHKLTNGKYIHTCSAARGVMYISPSVWDKMLDDRWEICVYLDGKGSKFHYIKDRNEFLQLVEKDDVVIKITGKEKVDVVNQLYSDILNGVKGTAYTLIRVASTTNMDAVFAHYVGSMAERNDGNEIQDENLDDY